MRLLNFLKSILLEINEKGALVSLDEAQKRERLFLLRYIPDRGMEQTVLAKELASYVSEKKISETFYGYILWIAGELMNNVFDHAQTLGKVLKGGAFALAIENGRIELAVREESKSSRRDCARSSVSCSRKSIIRKYIRLAISSRKRASGHCAHHCRWRGAFRSVFRWF